MFSRSRFENSLTQGQLAKAMGTSASAISRLEGGQHQPKLDTLTCFFSKIMARRVICHLSPMRSTAS